MRSTPRWIGTYAEQIVDARGHPDELGRVFARSLVPMVMVDDHRRYVEVNPPALSALGPSLAELRHMRLDDLTPPYLHPTMEAMWARLMETGCVTSPFRPPNTYLGVTYYALANALPGRHLVAFAPPGWPEGEPGDELDEPSARPVSRLTPRELEVLKLASEGRNGPMIARALTVSPATVRTHFEHIYAKLGVRDRAAAVAQAMRLGLIA